MFDFKRAGEIAKKALETDLLELIILGPQGAGKSYAIGSMGCKTLYLYGTRESHGPKSASAEGYKNLTPICIDYGVWPGETTEREFTDDESLQFLKAILTDYNYLKSEGYKAIAVDGMAVLESLVKGSTEWKERCKSTSGKHNSFKETEASQEMIGGIVNLLKAAQREIGCHIVVTGILDVKETDHTGAVIEATPRLGGYGLAEQLNQNFGDIVVVGKMSKGGVTKYKFQFMTDLTRVSKDEVGNQKKAMNFSPRLSGLKVDPVLDADLAALAKLKAELSRKARGK